MLVHRRANRWGLLNFTPPGDVENADSGTHPTGGFWERPSPIGATKAHDSMAKANPTRLLVVRSGRTEWDALGRVQGSADLPLSPAGAEAFKATLEELGGLTLDRIVCAPDEASRQTASLLTQSAEARKSSVCKGFAEMALGLWEGLRYEELEERYCRAGRLFLDDPSGVQAPEGEAVEEYAGRVIAALAEVLGKARAGSAVGIVVRPLALGVIRCALNDASLCELWSMVRERPDVEWYQVQKNDPRLAAPPRRPRRPASAA